MKTFGEPKGVHVYATSPTLKTTGGFSYGIGWPDVELLTLIASAVAFQQHTGPMALVTDGPGLDWAMNAGLDQLYQAGVMPVLGDDFGRVNSLFFWASAKIEVAARMPVGTVMVDTDAILWRKIPQLNCDVIALHRENRLTPHYAPNYDSYAAYGFVDHDWTADPVNTGVLIFNSHGLRAHFVDVSRQFMFLASTQVPPNAPKDQVIPLMPFAEQRLLSMVANRWGYSIGFLATLYQGVHIRRSEIVSHLWGSKYYYRACPKARAAYGNALRGWILRNSQAAGSVLAQAGLLDESHPEEFETLPLCPVRPRDWHVITEVRGDVLVHDPNVLTSFKAEVGDRVFLPCLVEPLNGATYKLEVERPGRENFTEHKSQEPSVVQ